MLSIKLGSLLVTVLILTQINIHFPSQARLFMCAKCELRLEDKVEPREELCNEVETVNGFCYLGDKVSANGGCEAAVTARARIDWTKFREYGELLYGKRFSLKMKGRVYRCCVRHGV